MCSTIFHFYISHSTSINIIRDFHFYQRSDLTDLTLERPCSTAVVHQIVALVTLVRLLARARFLLYIHRRRNLYVSYIEKKYSIKPKQSIKNIIQTVLSFVFTFCLSLQTLCFYHSFQSSYSFKQFNDLSMLRDFLHSFVLYL